MSEIPDDIMVEAMETLFRSKAKFEFAGTEQIEILAHDIAAAILAERKRVIRSQALSDLAEMDAVLLDGHSSQAPSPTPLTEEVE